MDTHYNAFISYRHHPDDIRVASEIHRSLEHFKVPKAIAKKSKPISRLFRDKEELPITSNLNRDIADALKNSDFLIVICSVHTKESLWVQREIELFLQTHDRSRVLTVLASGEPYDVIPEIILYEDIPDPATGQIKRECYEPLSCDWRLPRRQARHEELPRLAAALLGCRYDELRQRQRQYRTRRLIAVFSAALTVSVCLSAYFLYTSITIQKANRQIQEANVQIQANYDRALQNQSQYLTSAARARLDAGDRLAAIALAMEALPSQNNVRPYVPEAELVLCDALSLYQMQTDVVAVASFSPGDNILIREFRVTDDGAILYIRDDRGIITAWDADTAEKLATIDLDGKYVNHMLATAEHSVLLTADDPDAESHTSLFCFQSDGTLLWERENCTKMALLEDGNTVIAMEGNHTLLSLDAASGQLLRPAIAMPVTDDGKEPFRFLQQTYRAEYPISVKYRSSLLGSPEEEDIALFDLNTGTVTRMASGSAYMCMTCTDDEGRLYSLSTDTSNDSIGYVYNMRMTSPCQSVIRRHDIQTGQTVWETTLTTYSYTGYEKLVQIPGRKQLLYATGNTFFILDSETGNITAQCEAGSNILYVSVTENRANAILEDGYFCLYDFDENSCSELLCFDGILKQAALCNGSWTLKQNSTQVTLYASSKNDPLWEIFFQNGSQISVRDYFTHGDYIAFTYYEGYGTPKRICMVSAKERTVLWDQTLDNAQIQGFLSDGSRLILTDSSSGYISVDVLTGKTVFPEPPLPVKQAEVAPNAARMNADCLYWIQPGTSGQTLILWNLNTQTASVFPFGSDSESWSSCRLLDINPGTAWIWTEPGSLLALNLQTGESAPIGGTFPEKPYLVAREDEARIAICAGNEILLTDPDGSSPVSIRLDDLRAVSACFYGSELLVICDDGFLRRYGADGVELSRTELVLYTSTRLSTVDSASVFWYPVNDSRIITQINNMGTIIDCGSWKPVGCIPDFFCYCQTGNSILCRNGKGVAAFCLHDTQGLLEIAQEQLNGYHLTPEQKADYGIDSSTQGR